MELKRMTKKFKILVLAGGTSEERQVSLVSAKSIVDSLKRLGHDYTVIDTADGASLLDSDGHYLLQTDEKSDNKLALKSLATTALLASLGSSAACDYDLIFIALHGGAGENGTLQALLNLAGWKYTGSKMLASAVCMDKAFAKMIVKAQNMPTANWRLLNIKNEKSMDQYIAIIKKDFNLPLIIKPNSSGSTVGLTLVKEWDRLEDALGLAQEVGPDILVEDYIKGREITAAVLNGRPLPLVEIVPSNELYDYQCKYTKGKSKYLCPAPIDAQVAADIQSMAHTAYTAIGCSGLARVDFILGDGNRPFFLEVNTLPGMTELSLAPMAAKEAGISYDQLVQEICEAALS
jgi:D-alanine-D-alanine ligase